MKDQRFICPQVNCITQFAFDVGPCLPRSVRPVKASLVRRQRRWHQLTSHPNFNAWIPTLMIFAESVKLFRSVAHPNRIRSQQQLQLQNQSVIVMHHRTCSLLTYTIVEEINKTDQRQVSGIIWDDGHIWMGQMEIVQTYHHPALL
jgi:hypothetical protein